MDRSGLKDDPSKKRKHVRYRPDRLTVAKVQLEAVTSSFMAEASGLVYEEAYGGCCLVILSDKPLSMHDKWRIQVGHLHPMIGEIVWLKRLDDAIWKVGIKFLE